MNVKNSRKTATNSLSETPTDRPFGTDTECNNAKTGRLIGLASSRDKESMDTAAHKNDTTFVQSVCNVKQGRSRLLNVGSSLQPSTCTGNEKGPTAVKCQS